MKRILLIEDDRVDQLAILRLVKDQLLPYEIEVASSSQEGIEHLSDPTNNFDLLLLDYLLGDSTGIDILRNSQNKIPVVIITGKGNEDIAVEAMKLGAYDYIVKDIDRDYLTILPTRISMVFDRIEKDNELKILRSLLPICSSCKKIRGEGGQWEYVETYIEKHSNVQLTHGICDHCIEKLYPETI